MPPGSCLLSTPLETSASIGQKGGGSSVMVHSARTGDKLLNLQRPRLTAEQSHLIAQYPLLFRAVRNPEAYPSNLAHLGIQCGPGWYPIIEAAAREIEHELRMMWSEPLQNPESLSAMDEELLSGRRAYPVLPFCRDISQVAGELKMDIEGGQLCDIAAWKRLRKSVEQAASQSRYTCESCGRPGKFREIHWRHVYCDACVAPFPFDIPTK